MPDTLTSISQFINSPPGQLAAGGVLAGIVWKFFERVEAVLKEDIKLEIAVWLVGRRVHSTNKQTIQLTLFRAVFGEFGSGKHFIATLALFGINVYVMGLSWGLVFPNPRYLFFPKSISAFGIAIVGPIYFMLMIQLLWWSPAFAEHILIRGFSPRIALATFGLLFGMVASSIALNSFYRSIVGLPIFSGFPLLAYVLRLSAVPLITVSVWAWLPYLSGLLLRGANRFNVGFQGFTSIFDIEKKPLQAIGLVSGAIVAVIYWGVAAGAWLVKK